MKSSDIEVGGKYRMKVSGKLVTVRVERIYTGATRRTVYECTNLYTGRNCRALSASKFRSVVSLDGPRATQLHRELTAEMAATVAAQLSEQGTL